MSYAKGETESKYVLMTPRSYGEADLLDQDHMTSPPTLDDLSRRPATFKETYWSTPIFRIGVIAASYYTFPLFLKVFNNFQTIDSDDFDIVVGQIAPNGTCVSYICVLIYLSALCKHPHLIMPCHIMKLRKYESTY